MGWLRIALAQMNATVGDLQGNTRKILQTLERARQAGAHLVAFPELIVSGYPPEDLLLKPSFIDANRACLDRIIAGSQGIIAVVGFPEGADDLYNSAAIICDGSLAGVYRKHYLPNYGVFDEERYFARGQEVPVFTCESLTFGVSICEDIWQPAGPPEEQALAGGAQILLNISASPYYAGKGRIRERMLATRAADNVAIVAFCNLVGGQDELVFDGGSVIFDERGTLIARGPQFTEELILADVRVDSVFRQRLHDPRRRKQRPLTRAPQAEHVHRVELPAIRPVPAQPLSTPVLAEPLEPVAEIYQALVLGTRDYVHKNGFQKVVIGLSGGIDSSLTACIAADALGAENVTGVSMPSQFSSDHSQSDAAELARNLRIRLLTLPIKQVFDGYLAVLAPAFDGAEPNITEENLQARIRGNLLMALSNKFNWLVLTTGNKSETSVGYSTLYGDMAGGFCVIQDVTKMLVYDLCRYRNSPTPVIPERVFTKPPSAELRPGQQDTDSLPPYDLLDPILRAYVEEDRGVAKVIALGFDPATVHRVVRMVDRAEYKRRQAAPGIKVTARAFGKDRRLPITNRYEEQLD